MKRTDEFDQFVERIMSVANLRSGRVVKSPETTPLFAGHAILDDKEYVVTVVPTDLEPLE
jgi:hypothetical protein